ncbi:hypothetical protein GYMLUDRAFT_241479 [Collybiopsis luxurians FD-317 M1]|uniref:Unplaced genomic scaffold GYMLUscaffold_15, whole genome shotgun sequence n=1 Tax=Collybiopsis luxurians FD-317 M1 TaxID=944289 RepID=A0A0D0C634_9AGAR|nr:hypothetical protein GYMLUDRAFT_241479 [Collybiopsis luxurians FD-317 M1]
MAEAKLKALSVGSKLDNDYSHKSKPSPSLIPRRISHRHSHSTPIVFPLALPTPALDLSTTSSSRTSSTQSTLATPVNSVFNDISLVADETEEEDIDNDNTPTPSPKTKARLPGASSTARLRSPSNLSPTTTRAGLRSTAPVRSGQSSIPSSPALFRRLSISRAIGNRPGPSSPTLAMSFFPDNSRESHSPRVDGVSLISPPPMSSFSLPGSPSHQTTMPPNEEQKDTRYLTRSEYLLRSALLKDQSQSQNPSSPTFSSNASNSNPRRAHQRRHSHAASIDLPRRSLDNNMHLSSAPSSPSILPNRPSASPQQIRTRPASPMHTKSAPITHSNLSPRQQPLDPNPHLRSQSYSHALNHLPSTAGVRLPLTPHEEVLRARLEKVLSAGAANGNAWTPYHKRSDRSGSLSSDDSREREEYDNSKDFLQWKQKMEKKRKRASAPASGLGYGAGLFGWLWKPSDDQEQSDEEDEARQLQSQVEATTSHSNANSPRTLRTRNLPNPSASPLRPSSPYRNPSSPHRASSPHMSPYRGRDSARSPTPHGSPHMTPSRLRAHTQPLPASPGRSPYGQGFQYSPKPKHAFSLGTVSNVDLDLQRGEGTSGRMLTPPPTPPRESVLLGEGGTTGQVDSPVDLTNSTSTAEFEVATGSALTRNSSSASRGRRGLGIGRPGTGTRMRMGSEEDDLASSASVSESHETSEGPAITVHPLSSSDGDHTDEDHVVSLQRPALSLLSPPFSSPTSASSTASFNARTASLQCREIDGYVSFASVEGLGEPPASALPTGDDANSMVGDNEEEEGRKRGWVGRLFGR